MLRGNADEASRSTGKVYHESSAMSSVSAISRERLHTRAHHAMLLHEVPDPLVRVTALLRVFRSSRISAARPKGRFTGQLCPADGASVVHLQPGQDAGLMEAVLAGQLHNLAFSLEVRVADGAWVAGLADCAGNVSCRGSSICCRWHFPAQADRPDQ